MHNFSITEEKITSHAQLSLYLISSLSVCGIEAKPPTRLHLGSPLKGRCAGAKAIVLVQDTHGERQYHLSEATADAPEH